MSEEHDHFLERLLEVSREFHECEDWDPRQDVLMSLVETTYQFNATGQLIVLQYQTENGGDLQ
jgi:hypothetical protein